MDGILATLLIRGIKETLKFNDLNNGIRVHLCLKDKGHSFEDSNVFNNVNDQQRPLTASIVYITPGFPLKKLKETESLLLDLHG